MGRFRFAAALMLSACAAQALAQAKIRAVVLTGGHGYPRTEFFGLFQGLTDIAYVHDDQTDESEIFENVSGWAYDVIVMHNMGQAISPKRQANFISLLQKGVGLVVVHHAICAYGMWPEWKKIAGARYTREAGDFAGVYHPKSNYQHDTDIRLFIDDRAHPLMGGFNDMTIKDEVYIRMGYEKDNRVLMHTDHDSIPGEPQVWTRTYGKANVFVVTLGHYASTLTHPFMKRIVPAAIRWSVAAPTAARPSLAPGRERGAPQVFLALEDGAISFRPPIALRSRRDAQGRLSLK